MKKEPRYMYLGTNGTICSPVYLEGIYSIKKYLLTAEKGMTLTKDGITFSTSITVPEGEVELWQEVPASGQN